MEDIFKNANITDDSGKFLGSDTGVTKAVMEIVKLIMGIFNQIVFVIVNGLFAMLLDLIHSVAISIIRTINVSFAIDDTFFTNKTTQFGRIISATRDCMTRIALAIMLFIVVWQIFKSFFSYMGVETDDAVKLAMRALIFSFFIYYSQDILRYIIVVIYKPISDAIFNIIYDVKGVGITRGMNLGKMLSIIMDRIEGSLNLAKDFKIAMKLGSFGVVIQKAVLVYVDYNIVILMFKFAEKSIVLALLIITAPIAFACGVSKNTKHIFEGWIKSFSGILVVYAIYNIILSLLILYLFLYGKGIIIIHGIKYSFNGDKSFLFSVGIILGLLALLDQGETIAKGLGFNTGGISISANSGLDMLQEGMTNARFINKVTSPVTKRIATYAVGKVSENLPTKANKRDKAEKKRYKEHKKDLKKGIKDAQKKGDKAAVADLKAQKASWKAEHIKYKEDALKRLQEKNKNTSEWNVLAKWVNSKNMKFKAAGISRSKMSYKKRILNFPKKMAYKPVKKMKNLAKGAKKLPGKGKEFLLNQKKKGFKGVLVSGAVGARGMVISGTAGLLGLAVLIALQMEGVNAYGIAGGVKKVTKKALKKALSVKTYKDIGIKTYKFAKAPKKNTKALYKKGIKKYEKNMEKLFGKELVLFGKAATKPYRQLWTQTGSFGAKLVKVKTYKNLSKKTYKLSKSVAGGIKNGVRDNYRIASQRLKGKKMVIKHEIQMESLKGMMKKLPTPKPNETVEQYENRIKNNPEQLKTYNKYLEATKKIDANVRKAKEKLDGYKEKKQKVKETIEKTATSINKLQETLKSTKSLSLAEIKKIEQTLKNEQGKLEREQAKLKKVNERIKSFEGMRGEIEASRRTGGNIDNIKEKLETEKGNIKKYEKDQAKLEKEQKIVNKNIEALPKMEKGEKIDDYKNRLSDVQKVAYDTNMKKKEELQEGIKELKGKIKQSQSTISKLNEEVYNRGIEVTEGKNQDYRRELKNANKKYKELNNEKAENDKKIESASTTKEEKEKLQKRNQEIEKQKEEVNKTRKEGLEKKLEGIRTEMADKNTSEERRNYLAKKEEKTKGELKEIEQQSKGQVDSNKSRESNEQNKNYREKEKQFNRSGEVKAKQGGEPADNGHKLGGGGEKDKHMTQDELRQKRVEYYENKENNEKGTGVAEGGTSENKSGSGAEKSSGNANNRGAEKSSGNANNEGAGKTQQQAQQRTVNDESVKAQHENKANTKETEKTTTGQQENKTNTNKTATTNTPTGTQNAGAPQQKSQQVTTATNTETTTSATNTAKANRTAEPTTATNTETTAKPLTREESTVGSRKVESKTEQRKGQSSLNVNEHSEDSGHKLGGGGKIDEDMTLDELRQKRVERFEKKGQPETSSVSDEETKATNSVGNAIEKDKADAKTKRDVSKSNKKDEKPSVKDEKQNNETNKDMGQSTSETDMEKKAREARERFDRELQEDLRKEAERREQLRKDVAEYQKTQERLRKERETAKKAEIELRKQEIEREKQQKELEKQIQQLQQQMNNNTNADNQELENQINNLQQKLEAIKKEQNLSNEKIKKSEEKSRKNQEEMELNEDNIKQTNRKLNPISTQIDEKKKKQEE